MKHIPKFKKGDVLGSRVLNPQRYKKQFRIEIIDVLHESYKILDLDSKETETIPSSYLEESLVVDGKRVYTWDSNNLLTFTEGQAHGKHREEAEAQLCPTRSRRRVDRNPGTGETTGISTNGRDSHGDVPSEGRQDNPDELGKTTHGPGSIQSETGIREGDNSNVTTGQQGEVSTTTKVRKRRQTGAKITKNRNSSKKGTSRPSLTERSSKPTG